MSETVVRRSRWLSLPLLAVAIVSIAAPLMLGRLAPHEGFPVSAWAWSASEAWAGIVLGAAVGLFVGVLLKPWRARLATALGAALALAISAGATVMALPGAALGVPGCDASAPAVKTPWRLEARTLVDGELRDSLTLEVQPPGDAGAPAEVAIEDLGIDALDGDSVLARHCRVLISGSQATRALRELTRARTADAEALVPAELPVWRGNLDWWVSEDGRLVGVRFIVGGHPADAWPVDGLRGQLRLELWPAWMIEE